MKRYKERRYWSKFDDMLIDRDKSIKITVDELQVFDSPYEDLENSANFLKKFIKREKMYDLRDKETLKVFKSVMNILKFLSKK